MLKDNRQIQINASPEIIYDYIETMPNKFPIFKILESKPFLFLRILLVDGLRTAIEAVNVAKPEDVLILNVGDSMGPFTLTEAEKPLKYWFTLESFFFNCRTGYSLYANGSMTTLNFYIIAENPCLKEKVWWLFIKPVHGIFSKKVIRNIKKGVEN